MAAGGIEAAAGAGEDMERSGPGQIRFALVRLPPRRAGLLKPSRNGDVGAKEGDEAGFFIDRFLPTPSVLAPPLCLH